MQLSTTTIVVPVFLSCLLTRKPWEETGDFFLPISLLLFQFWSTIPHSPLNNILNTNYTPFYINHFNLKTGWSYWLGHITAMYNNSIEKKKKNRWQNGSILDFYHGFNVLIWHKFTRNVCGTINIQEFPKERWETGTKIKRKEVWLLWSTSKEIKWKQGKPKQMDLLKRYLDLVTIAEIKVGKRYSKYDII